MAAFVRMEEGNLTNGPLPPLKELFLEIQIQKLINEYLFSRNAGEMCMLLPEKKPSEHEQYNKAPEWMYAADAALQSAHDAPFLQFTQAVDSDHKQTSSDLCGKSNSQASPTLHSITSIDQDCGMNSSRDHTITSGNALLSANGLHGASLATTVCVERGGNMVHKTPHLSRWATFPCAGNVQLQVGTPREAKLEIKASCKKPPRPPKRPKSELAQSLTRCSSDKGAYLQSMSSKERKRKATATTMTTSASDKAFILAILLFTLCFATIMIAQGSNFRSQNSQNYSAYDGVDASSPTQTLINARIASYRRATTKPSAAEDSKLVQVAEKQASMEGFLIEREAARSPSYVVNKALLQLPYSYKALRT